MSSSDKKHHEGARATLIGSVHAWVGRYRGRALAGLAIAITFAFIAAQIVPDVQSFLTKRAVIPYLILLVVLDIAVALQSQTGARSTRTARDQDEALPMLEDAVSVCRREGADLLEYAGQTILPLVRALHREGVPIRMLVQHPDLVEGFQRQRNISTLDTIYNSICREADGNLEVRCYRAPYTLRGRRLGNEVLEVGWLTPDLDRKTTHGHDNPSIVADLSVRENGALRAFFERTFNDLWTAPTTEDARLVLEALQSEVAP